MQDQPVEYTSENSPTMYLIKKFKGSVGYKPDFEPGFFMSSLAHAAINHLCGENPYYYADPSFYYAKNKVKKYQERDDINAFGRLYPITGGFAMVLNPLMHETEKDKLRTVWHELAHTLFYRWDGELGIPEFQGRGWHPDGIGVPNKLEEEICEDVANRICPKLCVLLLGRPAAHYSLVKRLKEEDCTVHYISDETKFSGALWKTRYRNMSGEELIPYDFVIFDTGFIKDGHVEKANKQGGPMDFLRAKLGGERIIPCSKAEFFLNNYFFDHFEDGLCARDAPAIILADEETADEMQDVVGAREQRALVSFPYDIEDIVSEVRQYADEKFSGRVSLDLW